MRMMIVVVLAGAAASAHAKPKRCSWDQQAAVGGLAPERLAAVASGDGGPVSAMWDARTDTVSLVHTIDGKPLAAAPINLPKMIEHAKVLALERTATGYAAVVGTPAMPATNAIGTPVDLPKDPMRFVVVFDPAPAAAVTSALPPSLTREVVVAIVAAGGTFAIVEESSIEAFDAKLAPVGVAAGHQLASAAVFRGAPTVAVIESGDADTPTGLRIFDATAGAWKGSRTTLTDISTAIVTPLGDGVLVIALTTTKHLGAALEAAIVRPDGKLGAWHVWQTTPGGWWMDPSTLAVARSPGGDTFVQWSKQRSSGPGVDDAPVFFAAQVQPDGKLGPISAPTTEGTQVTAMVAADDGLYVVPNTPTSLLHWSCK